MLPWRAVGTEFVIPGYKLKNETKDGEKLLVLRDEYAAEFGGTWVDKMLADSARQSGRVQNESLGLCKEAMKARCLALFTLQRKVAR